MLHSTSTQKQQTGAYWAWWRKMRQETDAIKPVEPTIAEQSQQKRSVASEILMSMAYPTATQNSQEQAVLPSVEKNGWLRKPAHYDNNSPTQLLPSITGSLTPVKTSSGLVLPRYLKYERADKPLLMLYGACCVSIERFGRIADALFVSSSLIAKLKEQTEQVTGREYTGHFHFDKGDKFLKVVPVFTEKQLPDLLIFQVGYINHDAVIAICE